MKKILFLLGGLAAFSLVGFVVLAFSLGSIIKAGVNRYGPAVTKTKVQLAGAEISPLTGHGTISGLVVGNPAGWQSDHAISLGQARLSLAPFSLFGDHIVIQEIAIDQPEFVFETKIFSSNLQDLLKNIQDSTGGGAGAAETPTTKSGQPIRFEVKKFELLHGRVTVLLGAKTFAVPLPPITMTDLGADSGGITANQFAAVVMQKVLGQVLIVATDAYLRGKAGGGGGADALIDAAKQAAEDLKGILGGKK